MYIISKLQYSENWMRLSTSSFQSILSRLISWTPVHHAYVIPYMSVMRQLNSLTTIGYLLEVLFGYGYLLYSVFPLLLGASTGNVSQSFIDTSLWVHDFNHTHSLARFQWSGLLTSKRSTCQWLKTAYRSRNGTHTKMTRLHKHVTWL